MYLTHEIWQPKYSIRTGFEFGILAIPAIAPQLGVLTHVKMFIMFDPCLYSRKTPLFQIPYTTSD